MQIYNKAKIFWCQQGRRYSRPIQPKERPRQHQKIQASMRDNHCLYCIFTLQYYYRLDKLTLSRLWLGSFQNVLKKLHLRIGCHLLPVTLGLKAPPLPAIAPLFLKPARPRSEPSPLKNRFNSSPWPPIFVRPSGPTL